MKFKFSSVIAMLCLIGMLVSSCKKDNKEQPAVSDEEAQTISQEEAAAEAEYNDITEIGLATGADLEGGAVDNGRMFTAGSSARIRIDLFVNLQLKLGSCVNITASPNDATFPKTITINYGDGCLCRDGKFRKGIISLTFSAPIIKAGASVTIALKDFYVNRAHVEGVKTLTNLSANGAVQYSVQIAGGKVTWPNGRGFTYEGTKNVAQIEGAGTVSFLDDVYSMEGSAQIKYANGVTVTKSTDAPLIKPVACFWIAKGVLKLTINNRVLYLDYGAGACDNKGLLTWAGGRAEVTL
jgi:hypothetical protein